MIETVKVVTAAFVLVATTDQLTKKFKLNLGDDEIAELNAIKITVGFTAEDNNMGISVYRKNDNLPANIRLAATVAEDTNYLYWAKYGSGIAGFSGHTRINELINMPKNVIMVRSPTAIIKAASADNMEAVIALYYTIKKVSKNDISKLLIKYHS